MGTFRCGEAKRNAWGEALQTRCGVAREQLPLIPEGPEAPADKNQPANKEGKGSAERTVEGLDDKGANTDRRDDQRAN